MPVLRLSFAIALVTLQPETAASSVAHSPQEVTAYTPPLVRSAIAAPLFPVPIKPNAHILCHHILPLRPTAFGARREPGAVGFEHHPCCSACFTRAIAPVTFAQYFLITPKQPNRKN
ncbi:hypothetical protein [Fischerella sp. PCC 9605]|uniref:hypothetical protein n=1 Tax=Fischerella sp. PCC 9605 TaxID=1173024 RepID=UPI0012DE7C65|nr:hypothetical protein [Fischerella sp. PCC 9605]